MWQPFQKRLSNKPVSNDVDTAIRKATLISQAVDSRARKTDELAVTTPKRTVDVLDTTDNLFSYNQNNNNNKTTGTETFTHIFEQFNNLLQFQLDTNKETRLRNYKYLANNEEILEACLHEIVISCISSETLETPLKGKLNGDYHDDVKSVIQKEIDKVIGYFKMDENGEDIFRNFLTTGEFVAENVFSYQKPHLGIIDIKHIKAEHIEPIYRNFENSEIEFFICKKLDSHYQNQLVPQHQKTTTVEMYKPIPMACGQVTYCNSGKWTDDEKYIIPHIHSGFTASRQYKWLKECVLIDAINNAPERNLYTVPVGNQDPAQQRNTIGKFSQALKRKFGGGDMSGEVTSQYNPMSIGENIVVAMNENGEKITVEKLSGSSAFQNGFNGILTHVQNEIYEAMKVPISRLNPDNTQSDGATITNQDLAFSRRVESIQKKVASAIKKTVITHLKLKGLNLHLESCKRAINPEYDNRQKYNGGLNFTEQQIKNKHLELVEENYYSENLEPQLLKENCGEQDVRRIIGMSYWNQFDLKEDDIELVFDLPTSFRYLRQQQTENLKWEAFNQKVGSGFFSIIMAKKMDLGMTDDEILKDMSWQRIEAEKEWEKANILEFGPNFRQKILEGLGVSSDGSTPEGGGDMGGGSALGGGGDFGGGGGSDAPDFGDGGSLDDLGGDEAPDLGDEGGSLDDLESGDTGGDEAPEPADDEPVDIGDNELIDDEE